MALQFNIQLVLDIFEYTIFATVLSSRLSIETRVSHLMNGFSHFGGARSQEHMFRRGTNLK